MLMISSSWSFRQLHVGLSGSLLDSVGLQPGPLSHGKQRTWFRNNCENLLRRMLPKDTLDPEYFMHPRGSGHVQGVFGPFVTSRQTRFCKLGDEFQNAENESVASSSPGQSSAKAAAAAVQPSAQSKPGRSSSPALCTQTVASSCLPSNLTLLRK